VLLPSLLSVFGSWRSRSHLDWPFAVLTLVCELLAAVCLWELDRVALGTDDRLAVVAAQLVGNAAGRILPGGGATATAVSAEFLGSAGMDTAEAAAGFSATAAIRLATTLALPSRGTAGDSRLGAQAPSDPAGGSDVAAAAASVLASQQRRDRT
jgi:hypothetical protein